MRGPHRLVSVVALAAPLVGCQFLGPNLDGPVTHPSGSELVVRIEWTGGFVAYEHLFTSLPRFTLLGDGRVIVEGPQMAIFPGPALPNLQVRRLTEAGIQSVLYRITETGLFTASHRWDAANQFVADANTTVFTVHTDEREVVVAVYALGVLGDQATLPPGFPRDEIQAHQALTDLENDLLNLDGWMVAGHWTDPAWQSYQADALRLRVTNIDGEPPTDDPLAGEPLPWPSVTPPDDFGTASEVENVRCAVVSGDEAEAWYAALAEATELTGWSHDDHRYRVTPRPLLPDESLDCGTFTR